MNCIDIILLAIILGYCGYVLYKSLKKKDNCTHVCSSCASTSCHLNEYTKELKKIKEQEKKNESC